MYSQRPGAYAQIMVTPEPDPNVKLSAVEGVVDESMATTEQTLNSELAAEGSPGPMGAADMIKLQDEMANYTVAGETLSAIMKDVSDSEKEVIDRID
jgi:hypothetical protein